LAPAEQAREDEGRHGGQVKSDDRLNGFTRQACQDVSADSAAGRAGKNEL
jgi:hypothetical protein